MVKHINNTMSHNKIEENKLIWYPENGIGYYPVKDPVYDDGYFKKYEEYESTLKGKQIVIARINIINKYTFGKTLDIGIGSGYLIKNRENTYGYDVNPRGIQWLENQELYVNPYADCIDNFKAITFFDSFEHIKNPEKLIKKIGKQYIIISIPIFENMNHVLKSKHFRKSEHYHYYTDKGLKYLMKSFGFEVIEIDDFETKIGREDIKTYVFKRYSIKGEV